LIYHADFLLLVLAGWCEMHSGIPGCPHKSPFDASYSWAMVRHLLNFHYQPKFCLQGCAWKAVRSILNAKSLGG